jgi:GNAT superfamily N-acetyltransferase
MSRPPETGAVSFHFRTPEQIPENNLQEIRDLVIRGGAVGTSWIDEMLRDAFLIGYAENAAGRVVGCEVLKRPKEAYREKIETATGLDLAGYLERGYAAVAEGYEGRGIMGTIVHGLVRQAGGRKAYVTIRMDNRPALRLTEKNGMRLAGRYVNPQTGQEIGVFVMGDRQAAAPA